MHLKKSQTDHETPERECWNASAHLKQIRRQFLESVSMVLLAIAMIGMPLSLLRIVNTGLNPIHIAHIIISALIVGVFFLRKKLPDSCLLLTLLFISTSISLVGFLQYGLVSGGFYFAALNIFVGGIFLGVKKGLYWAIIHLLGIWLIAGLWISGRLQFPMDVNTYITLPSVWVLLSVSFILTTSVYFVSAASLISNLEALINQVNNQNQEIEKQSAQLVATNQSLTESNQQLADLIESRERELHEAMTQTLTAAESEARRIGEHIHDELCQDLVALSQAAGTIHITNSTCNPKCRPICERIQNEAGRLANTARNFSHDLAFYELDAQSLPDALETLIRRNKEMFSSRIEINTEYDLPKLNTADNQHIYRIIRELISNANKHAQARKIWIDIVDDTTRLIISVSNDGTPLPDHMIPGLGRRQIEMRTKILRGSFVLSTSDDGKTTAELSVPYSEKDPS